MLKAVFALVSKDVRIEFRNRYALGGILLYVLSSIMVVYFSLNYNTSVKTLSPVVTGILFWLIVLFSCINAISHSFFREQEGRHFYYYYVASPQAIILSKMLYHFIFTLGLILIAFILFSVMISLSVANGSLFLITALLGGTGYSFLFTLMGAIAARAGNNGTLVAVLGFPIIIPLLIFITKLTAASMAQAAWSAGSTKELIALGGFDMLELGMAYILFPYVWRD